MEKDTEQQILEELKDINKSLENMNNMIEEVDRDGKPSFIIYDLIRSLLIGIVIVGPAIAVVIIVFQVLYSWLFG
ncbi:hypothetical protein [Oceanobacillus rekensis]|uniref:hypothetical protein n=1 Tax=Oceanobacillus rekensis TaxID=937927 RepID=UPI000B449987|nr:hypothetical protein [Oceanobacillus rekensis]